jgi:hypothetical protein
MTETPPTNTTPSPPATNAPIDVNAMLKAAGEGMGGLSLPGVLSMLAKEKTSMEEHRAWLAQVFGVMNQQLEDIRVRLERIEKTLHPEIALHP